MSAIWDRLIECQNDIIAVFDTFAEEISEQGLEDFNQPPKRMDQSCVGQSQYSSCPH